MKILLNFMLLLSLSTCHPGSIRPAPSSKKRSVNDIIENLLNPEGDTMVIAHRGDWRHAPENSLLAVRSAIEMGVDVVEIDVRKTKDGHLVLMHDETLNRTTDGRGRVADWPLEHVRTLRLRNGLGRVTRFEVPTLEEVMLLAKGEVLVNLDKSYDFFADAFEILEKTGTVDHVIMKGKVPFEQLQADFGEYLDRVFFMPIVDLDREDARSIVETYQANMKPVAFEFVFETEDSEILQEFEAMRRNGSRVWVNSLWPRLNAGHDDDRSVADPDGGWGWILEKGANMIQTDRLEQLYEYLQVASTLKQEKNAGTGLEGSRGLANFALPILSAYYMMIFSYLPNSGIFMF